MELFFKKLEAVVSVTFPEMNSSVDIFLRTYWRQKQLFLFCFKIDQNNFSYMCGSWKNHFFVCSVCYSTSVNGNFKETFYLACFCFYLHFKHFHTAAFFSSRNMATGIFSHLLWCHSPQTEQNAMKTPLSSFQSSSKKGTRYLQNNGKRYVTSFPRLTRFVCCGNGIIVSFSNCANKYFLITLWL